MSFTTHLQQRQKSAEPGWETQIWGPSHNPWLQCTKNCPCSEKETYRSTFCPRLRTKSRSESLLSDRHTQRKLCLLQPHSGMAAGWCQQVIKKQISKSKSETKSMLGTFCFNITGLMELFIKYTCHFFLQKIKLCIVFFYYYFKMKCISRICYFPIGRMNSFNSLEFSWSLFHSLEWNKLEIRRSILMRHNSCRWQLMKIILLELMCQYFPSYPRKAFKWTAGKWLHFHKNTTYFIHNVNPDVLSSGLHRDIWRDSKLKRWVSGVAPAEGGAAFLPAARRKEELGGRSFKRLLVKVKVMEV